MRAIFLHKKPLHEIYNFQLVLFWNKDSKHEQAETNMLPALSNKKGHANIIQNFEHLGSHLLHPANM